MTTSATILRTVGPLATLAHLRRLAAANAHRPFDPWAGEPMLPSWCADQPDEPTTHDLYPTQLLPLVRTP